MSYRRISCQRDGPVLVAQVAADAFAKDESTNRSASPEIKEDLLRLAESITGPLLLDMSAVRSIAVDGFGTLILFERKITSTGHPWALCVNDEVWQLFRVTRLDQKVKRFPDIPTAVRELLCESQDAPPHQVD
jgi:anti-anti-sigma regulatory factor